MKQFQLLPKPEAGAPATGPVVPRQKRAQRTRTALLAAVEALVATEGADAVTTTRLAEITGVSVGTIYRYFSDREQLLLAAYDGTVVRIVETCGEALADLDAGMPMAAAARKLLGLYLDTAETIPAHSGLLAAMRALRPIEADQGGGNEASIVGDIVAPFLQKFSAGSGAVDPSRLHFLSVLMGTLVDLYLVTPDTSDRASLREEIEAHMLLALERLSG